MLPHRRLLDIVLTTAIALGIVYATASRAATWLVPSDFPTIGSALAAATAGDSIVVDCGTYLENTLTMTSDVVLRSATGQSDCVTIDAETNGPVFTWTSTGALTRLEGMTLINGAGGAIGFDGAQGTVRDCMLRDNSNLYGGAMEVRGASSITVSDCVFDSNDANGDGAISIPSGQVTAERCEFTANQAFEGAGAIWLGFGGSLLAIDCLFQGNHCTEGGTITGLGSSDVRLDGCTFLDNSSEQVGGGVFTSGALEVRDSTFQGNTGVHGSGVSSSADGVLVENSVFFDNQCTGYGAAIQCTSGTMTVSGCTIVANRAETFGSGLSVRFGGSVTVERSVIAHATRGGGVYCDGESGVDVSCSVVFGNLGGDWVGCLASQLGLDGNIAMAPLFCDVAGGDLTVAANSFLLPGRSPCGQQIGALGLGCGAQITAVEDVLPPTAGLAQNYPNPFNPRTTVPLVLAAGEPVRLSVFDVRGRRVRSLIDDYRPAGRHDVAWDGRDEMGSELASGVYVARLETAGIVEDVRMVLLR